MPAQTALDWIDIVVILLYLTATGYLGWLGWKGTKSASDFLLAGRGAHPVIMAVSYGATFLPAYIGGLFSRRITRAGAAASMLVGFAVSLFWLLFIKAREAGAIGLVKLVTDGKSSLVEDRLNWPSVDPIIVALPLAVLTLIVVSAFTRPPDTAHLARCFPEKTR